MRCLYNLQESMCFGFILTFNYKVCNTHIYCYRMELEQIRGVLYIRVFLQSFVIFHLRIAFFISILSYVLLGNYINTQKVGKDKFKYIVKFVKLYSTLIIYCILYLNIMFLTVFLGFCYTFIFKDIDNNDSIFPPRHFNVSRNANIY